MTIREPVGTGPGWEHINPETQARHCKANIEILERRLWELRKGKHYRTARREIRDELRQWREAYAVAVLSQT